MRSLNSNRLTSHNSMMHVRCQTHISPRHSALMVACRYGYLNVVQSLIAAGANVNLADMVRTR